MRTAMAVARATARVAEALRRELPDAEVVEDVGEITIAGRGLRARLRWIGGVLR
jgi:ParB-like chromosome segregation protein Spo0J